MSRENLRNTWYCPVCGGRLSYGIYCITCKVEASFAWRTPEKPDTGRARREWIALAARVDDPPEYQPDEDGDGELFAEAAADQADQEAERSGRPMWPTQGIPNGGA